MEKIFKFKAKKKNTQNIAKNASLSGYIQRLTMGNNKNRLF